MEWAWKATLNVDKLLDKDYKLKIKVIRVTRDKKSDKEFGRITKTDLSLPSFEKERLIQIKKSATDISFGFSLQRNFEKFGRKGQFKASMRVAQVLKGGAADRAGLTAGDLIEEVNEVSAESSMLEEMVTTIREAGECVNILVWSDKFYWPFYLKLLLGLLSIVPLVAQNHIPPPLFYTLLFVYIVSFGAWAFQTLDSMPLGKRFCRILYSAICSIPWKKILNIFSLLLIFLEWLLCWHCQLDNVSICRLFYIITKWNSKASLLDGHRHVGLTENHGKWAYFYLSSRKYWVVNFLKHFSIKSFAVTKHLSIFGLCLPESDYLKKLFGNWKKTILCKHSKLSTWKFNESCIKLFSEMFSPWWVANLSQVNQSNFCSVTALDVCVRHCDILVAIRLDIVQ